MGLSWLTSHYPWLPALQVGALQSVAGCVVLLVGVLSLCECENQEQSLVSSLQWLQWEQIGVICGTETTLQCSCQNSVHSRGIIFPFAASILLASRVLGWGKSRSCSQPGILFTMAQYPSQPIVPIRRQLRTAALHLKGKVRREKGRQAGSPNTPHWRSVSESAPCFHCGFLVSRNGLSVRQASELFLVIPSFPLVTSFKKKAIPK